MEWESFWRVLEPCKVAWNTSSTITVMHEFYNQSQTVLGLEPLPYLDGGIQTGMDPSSGAMLEQRGQKSGTERVRQRSGQRSQQSTPGDGGVRPPPPSFMDDNQVVTLSFSITEEALTEVIWNPDDEGNTYVRANMSYIALTDHQVINGLQIRRAGGVSLHMSPYSYQGTSATITHPFSASSLLSGARCCYPSHTGSYSPSEYCFVSDTANL